MVEAEKATKRQMKKKGKEREGLVRYETESDESVEGKLVLNLRVARCISTMPTLCIGADARNV